MIFCFSSFIVVLDWHFPLGQVFLASTKLRLTSRTRPSLRKTDGFRSTLTIKRKRILRFWIKIRLMIHIRMKLYDWDQPLDWHLHADCDSESLWIVFSWIFNQYECYFDFPYFHHKNQGKWSGLFFPMWFGFCGVFILC